MAAATEPRPRRKRGLLNKRLILDASAAMFHEHGYDRTTLDDIAGFLAVTKPTLYYYFANKEEILLECVRSAYAYFQEELKKRDEPAASGRRRVEIFARLYLEIVTHDIGVSMVLADDRVMSEEGREAHAVFRRSLNRALEDRVKLGVGDGSIVSDETRLTTYAVFGMFSSIGRWNFRANRVPLDEIFDRFIAIIFDGIGAKAG